MSKSHNIVISNFLLFRRSLLNRLSSVKVHKILMNYGLCKFITCIWNHSIGNDTSISCDTDITCTCSNIHKGNVKHTEAFRNCNINSSNRLQCKISNLKSCFLNCRIKSVNNILWKKCYNNNLFYLVSLMTFESCKYLTIEIILHDRVAYTIELVLLVFILLKNTLCLINTH